MFYDTLVYLLQKKEITAYRMAKDTGISTALISQWKSKGQTPSSDTLVVLANYFHVSVDYLLGRTNDLKSVRTHPSFDVQEIRTRRGLSQEDLAKKLDMPVDTVQKWESKESVPTFDDIVRIADELDIEIAVRSDGEEGGSRHGNVRILSEDEAEMLDGMSKLSDRDRKLLASQLRVLREAQDK